MKDWCWINRQVIRDHGKILGANGIAVLTMIASCENSETKEAFPSISYISQNLGLGRQAVMRAIKMLDSLGYLERTKVNGRRTFYKLTTPTGDVILDTKPVSPQNYTSITTELPPVSPQYSNDTNITNIIKEPTPVVREPKTNFLATNYFYAQYKNKYNTKYPVTNPSKYLIQLTNQYSELTFESFKLMIDRFMDGGGKDFQKFIWAIPELYSVVIDKSKEEAEKERNRKYQEYYSTENVRRRAMNGEE